MDDAYFMRQALIEAEKAYNLGEVPVGALIVAHDRIIARAHNLTEQLTDVTAHAEMQAFTAAASALGGKYLTDCTLFVSLEPCPMCAGAAYWTQISRIVYGAADPKRGFSGISKSLIHPKTEIKGGVLADEAGALIQKFFIERRKHYQTNN
ncbi:MAG: nucleoside deaminase [Bacteroidetes bacterium]|jgi:tRNA(adenine34) deaminase|nr:nucleoside deaminase [Bacteroidota bacterium]MBT4397847.1 nucleoside deaminase [Bacteroidota bacterium]MBT4412222.1 nucleoside deaminase [Bacteroidota bacterium]MBT5425882.1 nucleoside deaminase [Bacteroidota bacterium]MBT7464491.1 nucleoside deaminase [Bacteroidota bacterium]